MLYMYYMYDLYNICIHVILKKMSLNIICQKDTVMGSLKQVLYQTPQINSKYIEATNISL